MRKGTYVLLLVAIPLLLASAFVLSSCAEEAAANSPDYADGTYYAQGEFDERGRMPLIEITVLNGRIVAVYYDEVERENEDPEGAVTMSKRNNYDYAESWRGRMDEDTTQLSSFRAYENQLIENQELDEVDVVSGATGSHTDFVTVAEQALSRARQ